MPPVDLFDSARTMLAALDRREITAVELLDLHVRRIEQSDGALNAVITRDFERARLAAAAADETRARSGRDSGTPLLGLPLTIKDAIDVAGVRCTGGALRYAQRVASADAPSVARLRVAG